MTGGFSDITKPGAREASSESTLHFVRQLVKAWPWLPQTR